MASASTITAPIVGITNHTQGGAIERRSPSVLLTQHNPDKGEPWSIWSTEYMKTYIKQRESDGVSELCVSVPYHDLNVDTAYERTQTKKKHPELPATMVWVCVETAQSAKDLWASQDEWQHNEWEVCQGLIVSSQALAA